jgi:uncharacterized membrane protein YfcA
VILGVEPGLVALIAVVVVLGATVQNLVGLGLGLVAAPVVTLFTPELMPQLMLVLAAVLPALTLLDSHDDIDWRGLAWVLPARVPGTVLGVLLLGWFSDRALGVAVGVMVLLAVASSLRAVSLPSSPPLLLGAGFLSGAAGTTTSIGGPPVALLLQDRPPAQLRSTLAVFFCVGAVLSLAAITVSGGLEPPTVLLAAALSPCLWIGTWLGVRLRTVLRPGATRYAVLALCAASALTLLARSLG